MAITAALGGNWTAVPQDIALVGFDDIEDGRYSTPSFTMISPDKTPIARHAVDLLLRRLDGDAPPPVELSADCSLAVRESTTV